MQQFSHILRITDITKPTKHFSCNSAFIIETKVSIGIHK